MTNQFLFDVFLSHSAADKATVRALAARLRADGLRVWFDEWEIQPGDSIPAKIEEGLERSRILVLHVRERLWRRLGATGEQNLSLPRPPEPRAAVHPIAPG